MDTINTRVYKIRKARGLTQKDFSDKIGMKANSISDIENSKNAVTDYVIKLLCSEFNINEDWLRNGEGEMYHIPNDRLSALVSEITDGDDDFIKDLIETYMELDDSSKNALKVLAKGMAEKYIKREQSK